MEGILILSVIGLGIFTTRQYTNSSCNALYYKLARSIDADLFASYLIHCQNLFKSNAFCLAGTLVVLLFGSLAQTAEATQTAVDVSNTLNQTGNEGAMNSTLSTLLAVAFFLILPLLGVIYFYNGIVNKEEEVLGAWAQVESNYQRRADLIPNLVKTASAYMDHERETLERVIDARQGDQDTLKTLVSELVKAESDAKTLSTGDLKTGLSSEAFLQNFEAAQSKVGSLMMRLLATVEAYPDLRANDQMMALQAQLEGTENRINVARYNFNQKVEAFNSGIRTIPGVWFAGMGSFQRKAYFQSEQGAREAVQVDYN